MCLSVPAGFMTQANLQAQIISRVACNGSYGFTGDGGPATAAECTSPHSVTIDGSGNLYFADVFNHVIRKVSPSGTISTVAGGGGYPITDGMSATMLSLWDITNVLADASGNLYVADPSTTHVVKITPAGLAYNVAGTGSAGFSGDGGPATAATISSPISLAMDATGNLCIGDYTGRIRKVNPSGIISSVAGNGTYAYAGDGGPATAAKLGYPGGMACDASGNLYFSDYAFNVVRKISTSGTISTICGPGTSGIGDGGPATAATLIWPLALAFDTHGNLYIADQVHNRVRMINTSGTISTFAGTGVIGNSGDGGPATTAELFAPTGLAFDATGNLYIGDDSNAVVRKVTPLITTGVHSAPAVSGTRFSLFPNPNNGAFSLTGAANNTGNEPVMVDIHDIIGNTVYTQAIAAQHGNINAEIRTGGQLPGGLYFVHVSAAGLNEVLRLVIQK